MAQVELEVGGVMRRVEVEDGFTPDDLDYIASQLEGATSPDTTTTTTPTSPQPWSARPLAQAAGGVIGGTLAGAGGPLPAVAGAGLGAGIGGQTFDAVKQLFAGNVVGPTTAKELGREAAQVGGDVATGALSEMGGQITGKLIGKGLDATLGKIADRRARRLAMEARKAAFAKQGITPMASDLTQSRAVGQLENAPTAFLTGSGRIQRAREGQVADAIGAAERTLNPGGRAPEPVAAGVVMKGGVDKATKAFKARTGRMFDAIEREAGDEALVPTAPLREAIDAVITRKARTATGVGAATRNLKEGLGPGGREVAAPYAAQLTKLGLKDEAAKLLEAATKADRIPFWMARELEAQLGELQRLSRGQAIGSLRQAEYAQLFAGVRRGMDDFLDTEAGSEIAPRLAAVKQDYRIGKQLFNESLAPLIGQTAPEKTLGAVFKPTNTTQILDFRQAVSDDVWTQAVDAWKGSLMTAARDPKTGVMVPTKLAREIEKYEKGGTLDLILGQGADEVRDLANVLKMMGKAESVAGGANTSGTGQQLINSALLSGLPGYAANPLAGVGSFVLPNLLSRFVTSPTGVNALSKAATPVAPNLGQLLGPEGLRGITQLLGAEAAR